MTDTSTWTATNNLRWRKFISGVIPGTDGKAFTTTSVLEQAWQRNDGEVEWREIPTMMTDSIKQTKVAPQ